MSGYVVSETSSGGTLAVKAGIYPMKILRIDLINGDYVAMHYFYYWCYTGSSAFSGGSTVPVKAMRSAAPSASAQARVGDSLSLPPGNRVGSAWINAGSRLQTDDFHSLSVGQLSFQSPVEQIIAPGDVFGVQRSDVNIWTTIYIEELRL